MPLTDTSIRNAKPDSKSIRLYDERGLYLEVSPSGGKWWRLKYHLARKEKRVSLGVYPDVSLKEAREKRDEARKLVAQGIDPSSHRKAQRKAKISKLSNCFEVIAREWAAEHLAKQDEKHRARIINRLERNIFPWIGKKDIAEITSQELLISIRRISDRGTIETARRALGTCGQIFRYAIATGRAQIDPTLALRGALPSAVSKNFASITDPKSLTELLHAIDSYQGSLIVKSALRLAPLVFVRPGELRRAEWSQINFNAAEWRFTTSKTKTQLIVPLAKQAIEILRELYPVTSENKFVFSSLRSDRPISENAVLVALRTMGFSKEQMTGHGFRATARTLLDEILNARVDLIEHQLGHAVRDPNGRAYNRTSHLPDRRKMMQQWADYLDQLKAGGEVIPLHAQLAP